MKCELCGKTTVLSRKAAHDRMYVNARNNRKVKPNLHTLTLEIKGVTKKITACTRCMRTLRKTNTPRT